MSDEDLWQLRAACRASLVAYVRRQMRQQLEEQGSAPLDVSKTGTIFDENALTLGFARRFAVYKRPNLLLHDPDRLARILTDPRRPVQLVMAGKAHPADEAGQSLIEQ